MATKRLERTVIEGGRERWSKNERRGSHRAERASEREMLGHVRHDPAAWDDVELPRRPKAYKSFADKLRPAERWLAAQVGRPWWKVRGEILAKFDTRTLAGRHIVYDHLLPSRWWSTDSWRVARREFFVDAHGFLRVVTAARPRSRWLRVRPEVLEWAGERRIGLRGARAYWMERTTPPDSRREPRYRQTRELDPDELRYFQTLNASERERVVLDLDAATAARPADRP